MAAPERDRLTASAKIIRDVLKTIPYPIGALLIVSPLFLTSYWIGLLTQMIILALLAMSLDLLLGYTGLPSLGHAGLFGVAAYAVAILAVDAGKGFALCLLVALVAA